MPVLTCKCIKCGYEWTPRGNTIPKSCPYCHSYKWRNPYLPKDKDTKEVNKMALEAYIEKTKTEESK